jgi:hypothetical protein
MPDCTPWNALDFTPGKDIIITRLTCLSHFTSLSFFNTKLTSRDLIILLHLVLDHIIQDYLVLFLPQHPHIVAVGIHLDTPDEWPHYSVVSRKHIQYAIIGLVSGIS